MFTIDNNDLITVTRGDSFSFPIFINKGTKVCPQRYVLQEGDKVYLGIMEPNQPFEDALIRKVFTIKNLNKFGDVVAEFTPSDTSRIIPGKYYYEIKFTNADESVVNTITSRRSFTINN